MRTARVHLLLGIKDAASRGAPVMGWTAGGGTSLQLGQPVDGVRLLQVLASSAATQPLNHLLVSLRPRSPLFTTTLLAREDGEEEESVRLTLCRSLEDLSRAVWREVRIEGAGEDWASDYWRRPAGERLGLSTRLMSPDLVFLLVEYRRYRQSELRGGALRPELAAAVRRPSPATASALLSAYGTHFVKSYLTGDSLHQVLVFEKRDQQEIERKLSGEEWREVAEGRGAVGMGEVVSASGVAGLEQRLEAAGRRLGGPLGLWPVLSRPELRQMVAEGLGKAVLGFTLAGLQAVLPPPAANSIKERVSNSMALILANV